MSLELHNLNDTTVLIALLEKVYAALVFCQLYYIGPQIVIEVSLLPVA